MEYKHLLPFLVVVITLLTINLPTTSARRKPEPKVPTVPPVEDEVSGDYGDVNDRNYNEDDDEGSGPDEEEGSTGDDKPVPPFTRAPDFGFGDNRARTSTSIYTVLEYETDKEDNVKVEALKNLITHPAVLAAIIIGGVLTLLFIILLIMFIIYRMRKKDEGSYILDDPKAAMIDHQQQPQPTSTLIYTKGPSNDQEFYA